jgi:hypothetical protein
VNDASDRPIEQARNGTVASAVGRVGRSGWREMSSRRCPAVSLVPGSAFKGFRFPPEIIVLAVRWCLRYSLS